MGLESGYLWQRYDQEMAAASAASTQPARVAHLELALRYSLKVAHAEAESAHARWLAEPPPALIFEEISAMGRAQAEVARDAQLTVPPAICC